MWNLRQWHRRRLLRHHAIAEPLWHTALATSPCFNRLPLPQLQRLRDLTTLLLATKQINGAGGFEPDQAIRVTLGAMAALPILELDLGWYANWHEIVVYPDTFVQNQEWQDASGVMHRQRRALAGEAWLQGPVILSWQDIANRTDGIGLVIHELAHKLDMLNGAANGFPPLHRGMSPAAWTAAFSAAYTDLCERITQTMPSPIDPYGATNPAEFFAVTSETFFVEPRRLQQSYPDVYAQLAAFYRQSPVSQNVM